MHILYLIALTGIIALQIFLSSKRTKLGLILPILTIIFSIIMPIIATPFSVTQTTEIHVSSDTNENIEFDSVQHSIENFNTSSPKITIIYSIFLYNVFTVILFTIYIVFRIRKNKKMDLMRAQDLE
jgi:hypothetical protein